MAPSGVVGRRNHGQGHPLRSHPLDQPPQGLGIHVSLEGMVQRRLERLRHRQVDGLRAMKLDIGPRGVKMGVVRDEVAFLAQNGEEDPLGCPPLMRGDHVLEAEDVLHGIPETVKAPAAGVGFISPHDAGPLLRAHRRRSAVREEVDEHVLRMDPEKIIPGLRQNAFPFLPGRHPDGFHHFDFEGLDDRFHKGRLRFLPFPKWWHNREDISIRMQRTQSNAKNAKPLECASHACA